MRMRFFGFKAMEQSKENFLVVLLLAIFCLTLYFNSLWGIFLFDDYHSVIKNLFIKDARHFRLFFLGQYTSEIEIPQGMFRPLLLLTFSFNYFFSGLQPLGYHIINILLHFVNGILLYSFLRLLKPGLPFGLALLSSLLFLAHPLNTEAVIYISSRSDLMVFLFILIGSVCYLKRRFTFAFFSYLFGLLSKETALVFPFLIVMLDFLKPSLQENSVDNREISKTKNKYFFYLGMAAATLIYWLYRQALFGQGASITASMHNPVRSFYSNILTQSAISFYYLRLFIWPHPLTIHHNFPVLNSLFHPFAFFSVTAISLILMLIFMLRKKWPLVSIGLAWYLICLLPKFYAPLHIVAAEHHFYLPSFGIYLILAVMLKELYVKFKRRFYIAGIGILCLFTLLVWFRNYEFKDASTFWRKSAQTDPSSAIAHHNLGVVYNDIGLYPEAEEELKKTLSLAPAYADNAVKNVAENLANTYRLQKRFKEALEEINRIIQLGFYNFGTYLSLGTIYVDMGDGEKAEEAWKKGLSLNSRSAGLLYNLGLLYFQKSQPSQARKFFEQAIQYDPDLYNAHYSLGYIMEDEGQIDSAIKFYEKSIHLEPRFVDAHYRLGTLYTKKSDSRALWELKETIRLAPNFAEAHITLAALYASMQPPQIELAREHAQKAISLGYPVNADFLKVIGLEQK